MNKFDDRGNNKVRGGLMRFLESLGTRIRKSVNHPMQAIFFEKIQIKSQPWTHSESQ